MLETLLAQLGGQKNKTFKLVASNTIVQIAGKIISMTITVVITVIIARYYGRNSYGEFSIMQNWPALFYIIVDFGLNAIAVRELSKDWSKAEIIYNTIATTRILFSVGLVVVISTIALFFPYSTFLKTGLVLTLWLILTQGLYASNNIIFQTKLKYDYSTNAYLLGYVVILLLVGASVYFKLNVIFLSFSYVIGGVVTYVAGLKYIKMLGVLPKLVMNKQMLKYLFIQSLPLGFMFIFSQLSFKSDSILMSLLTLNPKLAYNNNEAVALYSLPYKIFEVSLVVPTFVMNSVYPILVNKLSNSRQDFIKTFRVVIKYLALSAVIISIIGILVSPFVINILGGAEFKESIVVLQILMAGLMFYFLTQPLSWFIVTLEKQSILPYIYLASALFNITANIIFIPKYAFYASSVITHISELIVLVLLVFYARRIWRHTNA